MKVYRVAVELELDIMVVAQDEDEARRTAKESADEELRNWAALDLWYASPAVEVKDAQRIPAEWKDSCPCLSPSASVVDGNLTVERWLEKLYNGGPSQ